MRFLLCSGFLNCPSRSRSQTICLGKSTHPRSTDGGRNTLKAIPLVYLSVFTINQEDVGDTDDFVLGTPGIDTLCAMFMLLTCNLTRSS